MNTQLYGSTTAKQRGLLTELGYAGNADGLTKAKASELIKALTAQRKAQIEAGKERAKGIDLAELAGKSVALTKNSTKDMHGPCPLCGDMGHSFHVSATYFWAYCCDKQGDQLTFLQALHKCDFTEACLLAAGDSLPMATVAPRQSMARTEQPAKWLTAAARTLAAAQSRLAADDAGAIGRAYLEGRGLRPETWAAYGLGLADVGLPGTWDKARKEHIQPLQPAIVIPWFAKGGKRLVGLRYRFLQNHTYAGADGNEQTAKQSALYGSDFTKRLFGAQALPGFVFMPATAANGRPSAESGRALLICEGEINCMSGHQVGHSSRLDVVSIGSESATLSDGFAAWAGRYGQIITWLDDRELAAKAALALPGAHAIDSLSMDKRDANDLLREGLLGAFLATVRFQLCQSKAERQALFWALSDEPHMDEGTAQVLALMKEHDDC